MKHGLTGHAMSTFLLILIFGLSSQAQKLSNFQDCIYAYPICEFKTYHFDQMKGFGKSKENIKQSFCFEAEFEETNSYWLKWRAESTGILTFVINPNQEKDDFDFVLFLKKSQDCSLLDEVRCMASGENIGDSENDNRPCIGRTGLSINSLDAFEKQGCKFSSDNFLKMLQVEKGEEYVLLINNYNSEIGFSITFEGESKLKAFSNCESLDLTEPIQILNLYPNPAINSVNIEYTSPTSHSVLMEIMDITGKVYSKFENVPQVGKNINSILVNKLTSGTYILSLKQDNFTSVRQFIKE